MIAIVLGCTCFCDVEGLYVRMCLIYDIFFSVQTCIHAVVKFTVLKSPPDHQMEVEELESVKHNKVSAYSFGYDIVTHYCVTIADNYVRMTLSC